MPNVCNALGGKKFEALADVTIVSRAGPPVGANPLPRRTPLYVNVCLLFALGQGASTVTAPSSSNGNRPPNKPSQDPASEPKIRVTPAGGRYVEPRDMFDHPKVRERLKKADQVATQLGIKGRGR